MSITIISYPRNYVVYANAPIELTIGLEVHAQLSSEYKLFSGRLDTLTTLDVGLPGSLPILNLSGTLAIEALASLLSSKVSPWLSFTRKGYFCADLSTGYQITQCYNPLLAYGNLKVCAFGISGACRVMLVHIQRVNLEHDTGSVSVLNSRKVVSFARAGVGLLEFVSFPCLDSVLLAKLYLLKLKLVLLCLRLSSCIMANAEMRYDFNVSTGSPLSLRSARTEVKNLNSLSGLGHIALAEAILACQAKRDRTKALEFKTFTILFLRRKERAREYKRLLEVDMPFVRALTNVRATQQRLLCALARCCWLFSCGRFSLLHFSNLERFCYQAYVFSQAGFSCLRLVLKRALIV
ncbi:MAG: hypothetical protein AAI946_00575 [Candidatus Hodgkinia cicadicola]